MENTMAKHLIKVDLESVTVSHLEMLLAEYCMDEIRTFCELYLTLHYGGIDAYTPEGLYDLPNVLSLEARFRCHEILGTEESFRP